MKPHTLAPVVSPEEIARRLDVLSEKINADYRGQSLVVIGVLKGAFVFMADLVRRLTVPVEVDFVRLSSYGNASETCGKVRLTKSFEVEIKGRHVLVIEDIVDTGITLDWFLRHLRSCDPESVKVCAFIDKAERRQVEVPLDYVGIDVPDGFLVGYGMDFSEHYRNLDGIFEVRFTG